MATDPVFLDTSGWLALLHERDSNHGSAVAAWREFAKGHRLVVVTDWVIAETGNGLAKTSLRGVFADIVKLVASSPEYQLVEVGADLLERAVALYADRRDKVWGLVDCASFLVMSDLSIHEALTADHHFEQAGFRTLLPRDGGANGQ